MSDQYTRIRGGALLPGEPVLWRGRPRRPAPLAAGDAFLLPFGAAFTAGGVWLLVRALLDSPRPPALVTVLCGVVAGVGVWVLFGRLWWKRVRRARTWYSMTPTRAVVQVGRFVSVKVLSGEPVQVLKSRTGGTLVVGRPRKGDAPTLPNVYLSPFEDLSRFPMRFEDLDQDALDALQPVLERIHTREQRRYDVEIIDEQLSQPQSERSDQGQAE